MEIDKVQLVILSILEDSGAECPGKGMTLKEIADKLKENFNHNYSKMTINRKVWGLRDAGYITSKLKLNKADLFYILAKGKAMREILFKGGQ